MNTENEVNKEIEEWKAIAESNANANSEACKAVWHLQEERTEFLNRIQQLQNEYNDLSKINENYKEALLKSYDIIRDIDLYGDLSRPKKTIQDCSNIATKGLEELHNKYPFIINLGVPAEQES